MSWNSRKKLCILRVKIVVFGQFYAKNFRKKQIHYEQIILPFEWQQMQTRKLCYTRCLRDNANVIT